MSKYRLPSVCVSLVIPPMASFALRGTVRELTWYPLVEITPSETAIALKSNAFVS